MAAMTVAMTVVLQALVLFASPPAGDAPAAELDAREHYAAGAKHYERGEAAQALESFRAAYTLAPHAELLFNIAQCHRKLGDAPAALDAYDAYLRARPDAPNRAEVEQLMNGLRPQPRPTPRPTPRDTAETLAPLAPTMLAPAVAEQPSPSVFAGTKRATWLWVAAGVLVTAAGIGLGYVLLSPSESTSNCKDPACIKPL